MMRPCDKATSPSLTVAVAAALLTLLTAGCHKDLADTPGVGNDAVAHGFHPPETRAATPLPGQVQTTPLTAYVGHYPGDAVDGVGFFDRTEVATALNQAVIDPLVRRTIMRGGGPQTPIFAKGGRVASWGCEAHDCSDHNWTLFVDPATKTGTACYHDRATMGARSHWYAGAAPVTKAGTCPSGDGAVGGDAAPAAVDAPIANAQSG